MKGGFMEENNRTLKAIEQSILVISREIKRNKGCGGDKLNAYGRLINAYGRMSDRVREQNEKPEDFFKTPKKILVRKQINPSG
jgi:hypothetical protein